MHKYLLIVSIAVLISMMASAAPTVTRQQMLQQIHDAPGNSDHYVDLANILDDEEEKITLLPVTMTRQELYKFAIAMNPNNAVAYNNLAVAINDLRATIKLSDGKEATMQQLFLKAIEVDPTFGPAYNNLAETMNADQKLNYPDGRSITRKEMFIKAVELDASYPSALYNLGRTLLEEDREAGVMHRASAKIGDDQTVTARRCFLLCIERGDHPALKYCYSKLADTMAPGETVRLLGEDDDAVDKADCVNRAERLGLKSSSAEQEKDL